MFAPQEKRRHRCHLRYRADPAAAGANGTELNEYNQVDPALFEDDSLEQERRQVPDFTADFEDFESEEIVWSVSEEATLPLQLTWQQTSESRFELRFSLPADAACLGLGERQSGLNLRFARHTLFNTDDNLHVESIDSMYKSIPFLLVNTSSQCFGLFLDSPARQRWDLDSGLTGVASVELLSRRGWQLYCFGPGSLSQITAAFTRLTGRSKMPPLWSLGHQQSRWSYPDQDTVVRIAHEFRFRKIPCDTIVLDIDYMDEYRVFTASKERFPDFKQLISDLRNNNFRVVTIVDPAVKKDPKFFVFNDGKKHNFFCTRADGKLFIAQVWPGPSALPDFMRDDVRMWWAAQHGFYTDAGVAGIWNDMNEPAILTASARLQQTQRSYRRIPNNRSCNKLQKDASAILKYATFTERR